VYWSIRYFGVSYGDGLGTIRVIYGRKTRKITVVDNMNGIYDLGDTNLGGMPLLR
jgi:hypothetical protein